MSCNLLIVDDSPILRAAIKKVVKLAGLEEDRIFEAGNGKEALELMSTIWVDMVLLDLNMPVMNGEEFAQELRKQPELEDVAVVVVSTESNEDRLNRMEMSRSSGQRTASRSRAPQAITDDPSRARSRSPGQFLRHRGASSRRLGHFLRDRGHAPGD